MDNWRNGTSASVPSSPSSSSAPQLDDPEVVGTVIVRDLVSRTELAHFRAHTSPLMLLRFDGSGTLLVTASVHGHTVNVYHISPSNSGSTGSAVHLFRLSRGVTPAVIQDAAFSQCGHWLCVSSARVSFPHLLLRVILDLDQEWPVQAALLKQLIRLMLCGASLHRGLNAGHNTHF